MVPSFGAVDATEPYAVRLGDQSFIIVAAADDKNISPSFLKAEKMAAKQNWLLMHRPFLTESADDEANGKYSLTPVLATPGKSRLF